MPKSEIEKLAGGLTRLNRRERVARAVYKLRPFRTAMSTTPLERNITESRLFEFDEAPAFYLHDCYEIADAVLDALKPRAKVIDHLRSQG